MTVNVDYFYEHVAPFSAIVEQDYSKESYSEYLHICENNVGGLKFVVTHWGIMMCSCCGYVKPSNPGPGQVIMGEEDEDPTTE